MKLLMITGLGSAKDLASGKKGAFYNTLEEFHKYWDRIDIMAPKITKHKSQNTNKSQTSNSKIKILFGNVYIHISPWPLMFHPFWFLKKGLEIYKEQKFDLMTVHEFPPFYNGIGARLLWNRIKVPYVLEIMHIPGFPKAAGIKERLYSMPILWKFHWKFIGSKAKAVRVMSNQVKGKLIKLGFSESKIKLIPAIYIDLDVFRPRDVIKEYDVIFVGRLEKNKGIELLLEAIKNLKSQISNLKCLIVGDGPLKKKLLRYCATALQANVVFYGWAKDSREIAELLNKSKILVMPSYNEGGPRVVLEAMACGLPIITTRVGLMPDIIKGGENGLFTDWSAEDMAEKILGLLKNKELQERFSKAGLELVKQFEKKVAIKNYAEKLKSEIPIY